MTTEQSFTFTNVNLAAVFKLYSVPITSETHDTLIIFSVPKTEQVLKIIEDFNADGFVPVKSFITCLQEIKKDIYGRRDTARGTTR